MKSGTLGLLQARSISCSTTDSFSVLAPAPGPWQAPHISLALAGIEIISNGSGSHHQLRKLDTRLDLICSATAKAGGVYLYANQQVTRD
jgi:hypothetical protein